VVLGGILAALITLFFSGRQQDRELERAARHLAIRLIDIFERFALACTNVPGENGRNQRDDPYDFGSVARLPELDGLPDDDSGWRAIEAGFAIDSRTFGTRVDRARELVGWSGENGDADDAESEVEKQAGKLGATAWQLSQEMRQRYGLSEANPGWDVDGYFKETIDRIAKREVAQLERAAEFWNESISADI
jgi:hypothetical protein